MLASWLLGLPVIGARLIGLGWATIGGAYAIWLGVLATIILMISISPTRKQGRVGEMIGWLTIFTVFWTLPAIVALMFVLAIAGVG